MLNYISRSGIHIETDNLATPDPIYSSDLKSLPACGLNLPEQENTGKK